MIRQIVAHADLKIFMHTSLILFLVIYAIAILLVLHPKRKKLYQELAERVIQDERN